MTEASETTKPDRRHFDRAMAALEAGRLDEAEKECRNCLALAPQSADGTNVLAVVLGRTGRSEEAIRLLRDVVNRRPDFAPAAANLGLLLRGLNRHAEALDAFRKFAAADPASKAGPFYIGATLMEIGRTGQAIVALEEAVRRDPGNGSVRHMLAALRGEATVAPPIDFVRGLFDDYAASFDTHLVGALGYKVPAILRGMIDRLGPASFARVLDLGCGTGLAGAAFAGAAAYMVGVDVSTNMIGEAQKKNLYAELHALEFDDYFRGFKNGEAPFDLVLAADVFIYVGRLDTLFGEVSRRVRPGGLFAFSVERLEVGDFKLRPTGRYAHSAAYIQRLARPHGFTIAAQDAVTIREGYPGDAFVLKRG